VSARRQTPATPPDSPDMSGASGLIKLAILAVGGQGGGVLTNWIRDLAERGGYRVQTTSVPGVAQRTGATIYYVEMLPQADAEPVLALMPTPGDVDIVIAAELMEAGRAVTRGLVTSERTTLIASTHRMYAVSEKIVPGDGAADSGAVLGGIGKSARRLISGDFHAVAARSDAHISASLFGALAGAAVLPFDRAAFEETIRASGRGVTASLGAFAAALDLAAGNTPAPAAAAPGPPAPQPRPPATPKARRAWERLLPPLAAMPATVRPMARAGLAKVVDFQDAAYGQEYLGLLQTALSADRAHGGEARKFAFSVAMAKHLANAMAYDDVIRVADLKTRGSRAERVRADIGAEADDVLQVTEYLHPRAEEIIGLLPAGLGRFVETRAGLRRLVQRGFAKGRRIRSDRLGGFLTLYVLGGMRWRRRSTLRHRVEVAHRDAWLARAMAALPGNYDLAVETVNARRLIKGYGDTHGRGLSRFDKVLDAMALVAQRDDAGDWARRLITAALADVTGDDLDGVIRTIRSFA